MLWAEYFRELWDFRDYRLWEELEIWLEKVLWPGLPSSFLSSLNVSRSSSNSDILMSFIFNSSYSYTRSSYLTFISSNNCVSISVSLLLIYLVCLSSCSNSSIRSISWVYFRILLTWLVELSLFMFVLSWSCNVLISRFSCSTLLRSSWFSYLTVSSSLDLSFRCFLDYSIPVLYYFIIFSYIIFWVYIYAYAYLSLTVRSYICVWRWSVFVFPIILDCA